MTTITTTFSTDKVVVSIQRYDEPVMIGIHEYDQTRHLSAMLLEPAKAAQAIQFYLDDEYEEIDPFQASQMDAHVYQMVKRSLPIEFHREWAAGNAEMCERIRVFVHNRTAYDPSKPHCTKELRFRDGAGNDGGGHIQCLAELFSNGTCPRTNLHHDVYIKTRDWSKCTPNSHVGGCVCVA